MKISFIEPHMKLYGGIRRIIELVNRLSSRGHEVTIFHSNGSQCEWMKCAAKIKSRHDALREVHDVVIYNHPNPLDYYLVKKAEAKLKIFYVLELYDTDLLMSSTLRIILTFSPRTIMRLVILKKSLLSPYLKLTNATWLGKWLKENMGIDSKLLIGGISSDVFHPVELKKNQDIIKILCSGDPRPRKGARYVIEAVDLVRESFPNIILENYYGKGISQDKMAEIYSQADIFVDGQFSAGWNNPVAEAMACKVPVVCTAIGGVQDFALNEDTALLVPVKQSKAMAEAIKRLINDKDLREKLIQNAYSRIRQFDWDKSTDKLEEIIKSEL